MIWIIGDKGMLGRELKHFLKQKKISYYASDKEIDITSFKKLQKFIQNKKIKYIINCSGYTNVEQAETDIEKTFMINYIGILNLSIIAKKLNAIFISISTDYVFDGKSNVPYRENEKTNPLSIYGKSKLDGENLIQFLYNKYFVIRTSWLYGKFGKNFVYTILNLIKEKKEIKVVKDQIGTPTYTLNLCEFIYFLISNNIKQYGIYHFSNEGEISWYDFANKIYEISMRKKIIKNKCNIKSCYSNDLKQLAKRPKYSVLSKEKIIKKLKYKPNNWETSLNNFLTNL